MKEDFLHYIWQFKKFDLTNLRTSANEAVTVLHSGQYLKTSGPDFFNAQLVIGDQKWAGNVEIHIKSSDWYLHKHEQDEAYDNVILHVVWENDTAVFGKNNQEIPVLELKNYISSETLDNYQSLMQQKSWIYCERQLPHLDSFVLKNWQQRLFFERLERKSEIIENLLEETQNDWEAVLFLLMAKNFGLNTNGETFMAIAKNISFEIIRKESFEPGNLEALFFGFAGLIENNHEDQYFQDLKFRFYYLLHKYGLEKKIEKVEFFKHRPDNFPTIRLSQLSNLYSKHQNLFGKLLEAENLSQLESIFEVSVSDYWLTHYQFDRESPKKQKRLSKAFIDLLIINTVVPVLFAYSKSIQKDQTEFLLNLMEQLPAEQNAVLDKFSAFGIKSENAFESQALLELKKNYCQFGKCLSCTIGMHLLKNVNSGQ